jgi:ferric-dicitrate binding protein FerR (iron transport regulator)
VDDALRRIDAYLDGNIDDVSMDLLDQMIASDSAAAALFAQRSMMHHLFVDHELVNRYRASQSVGAVGLERVAPDRRPWRRWVAGGAMAAGILIAATLLMMSPPDGAPVPSTTREAGGQPVGLMVSSTEVLWVSEPVEPGQSLDERVHQIASGAIEFQSHRGPTVTVLGPTTFEMTDPMRMRLTRGRMHATVPRIARGFTVEVGSWSVVDLGTVFGVVADGGEADVYVYDGTVRVSAQGRHQL